MQERALLPGQQPAASTAFRSLAVAAVRRNAAVAAPEVRFFQGAQRQLQDEGRVEAFRAELKPLLLRLGAARHLEGASLARTEVHAALDAVHALLARLALGGLCEEFAAYVPSQGRDYWRTLTSTSDGTTGCLERPVSPKENAPHQLAYQA